MSDFDNDYTIIGEYINDVESKIADLETNITYYRNLISSYSSSLEEYKSILIVLNELNEKRFKNASS